MENDFFRKSFGIAAGAESRMSFRAFLSVWGGVSAARVIWTAVEFAVLALTWSQCSSAYPSLIEFGLDDEDAIDGYYDVVYLCAVAIAWEQKVIDDFVAVFGQFFQ